MIWWEEKEGEVKTALLYNAPCHQSRKDTTDWQLDSMWQQWWNKPRASHSMQILLPGKLHGFWKYFLLKSEQAFDEKPELHTASDTFQGTHRLQLLLYLIWGWTQDLQVRALTTELLAGLSMHKFSLFLLPCNEELCKDRHHTHTLFLKSFCGHLVPTTGRKQDLWSGPVKSDLWSSPFHPPPFSVTLFWSLRPREKHFPADSRQLISFSEKKKKKSFSTYQCLVSQDRKIFQLSLSRKVLWERQKFILTLFWYHSACHANKVSWWCVQALEIKTLFFAM